MRSLFKARYDGLSVRPYSVRYVITVIIYEKLICMLDWLYGEAINAKLKTV